MKMSANPILQVEHIQKEFSGIYALSDIDFDVYSGEIHCLVGENGAGKSTLMKILTGAYVPSAGSLSLEGVKVSAWTPALAKERGIRIVYQENDLVPAMNIVENIYIGNETMRVFPFVDFSAMLAETKKQMKALDIDMDPLKKIEDLSVSEQQFVKILKALSGYTKVLIMDEPTSMFNTEDAKKVRELAKRIAQKGIGIIYISHYLEEVIEIANRITVIRDGRVIRTYDNTGRTTKIENLTKDMVGREISSFYQKEKADIGDVFLQVEDLQVEKDAPKISFCIRRGEVLGFAGMVGSGRTEIVRALTGADKKYGAKIMVDGKEVRINNPSDSIKHGFAHITEDRQKLGLMLQGSILENATIVGLGRKIKGFFMNYKKHTGYILPLAQRLHLKPLNLFTEAIYLSGGNQQKVVLAKWLFADGDIYIFDEPTRGIDIHAKAQFYQEISKLSKTGKAVILISSDMTELISLSDRVLVIREGDIVAQLSGADINEEEIIKRALGV